MRPLLIVFVLLSSPALASQPVAEGSLQPDQRGWSETRKDGYQRAQGFDLGSPQAILHLPSLDLTVPVYPGTGKLALEAGAGWVESTAPPGEPGNTAIAAHRDGFFSSLRNAVLGDPIRLRVADQEHRYRITSIQIVDALDLGPLEPTSSAAITLITCHPFDYRGYAPDRYIVRAELTQ